MIKRKRNRERERDRDRDRDRDRERERGFSNSEGEDRPLVPVETDPTIVFHDQLKPVSRSLPWHNFHLLMSHGPHDSLTSSAQTKCTRPSRYFKDVTRRFVVSCGLVTQKVSELVGWFLKSFESSLIPTHGGVN